MDRNGVETRRATSVQRLQRWRKPIVNCKLNYYGRKNINTIL